LQRRTLAVAAVAIALCAGMPAQTSHPVVSAPSAAPAFDVADVHSSYRRYSDGYMNAGLVGDRYILRQIRMLDLISVAYDIDWDHILGASLWMEADSFDVLARAPAGTSQEQATQMLRTLLADRFKLAVHTETRVMPAYVLSLGKGAPKIKHPDEAKADQSGCGARLNGSGQASPGQPPQEFVLFCNSATMQQFAENFHNYLGRALGAIVVDSTGLKGTWDIEMHIQGSPWSSDL